MATRATALRQLCCELPMCTAASAEVFRNQVASTLPGKLEATRTRMLNQLGLEPRLKSLLLHKLRAAKGMVLHHLGRKQKHRKLYANSAGGRNCNVSTLADDSNQIDSA